MNTHILIAPHRLATTRFNSSRTTFTLLRTITSHFICGFFVALFNVNFILFNTLRENSIGIFANSIVTFTNSVKYSAVNTTSLLKKTSQNCHLIAYFVLPNGTKSQPSQVLSFVARTI
ncbi:hypothetical protein [uncultured Gammaproteobacteria bacterium]|nr:hypothetical protein [uncultured Gammaproteobacteria bacterium]